MIRAISDWLFRCPPIELAIRDVAREIYVSEHARILAELERLVALAYARRSWS